jgi:hypothetical protein
MVSLHLLRHIPRDHLQGFGVLGLRFGVEKFQPGHEARIKWLVHFRA